MDARRYDTSRGAALVGMSSTRNGRFVLASVAVVACAGASVTVVKPTPTVAVIDAAIDVQEEDVEFAAEDVATEDAAAEASLCIEDCPARMDGGAACRCPGHACNYEFGNCTCFYGSWQCFDVVNACPRTFGQALKLEGAGCTVNECSYARGSCACTRKVRSSCGGNPMSCSESSDPRDCPRRWVCAVKPPPECPEAVPRSGSSCSHPGLVCGYACESATCTQQGTWFVPRRPLLP